MDVGYGAPKRMLGPLKDLVQSSNTRVPSAIHRRFAWRVVIAPVAARDHASSLLISLLSFLSTGHSPRVISHARRSWPKLLLRSSRLRTPSSNPVWVPSENFVLSR